jgi:polyisoprenoid-binding protein YceI
MKLMMTLLLLFSMTAFADHHCELNKDSVKVSWTAYKTPLKVGVGGALDKVAIEGSTKADNFEKLVKGLTLNIGANIKSVNTKNKARDIKIANFFFGTLEGGATLQAKGKSVVAGKKITIDLTMNGVTKEAQLKYSLKKGVLVAEGVIDVLDWAMSDELKAINKACFAKHEGKTWSDVAIKLEAKLSSDCK